ncbi:iron-sulfur cluster insertion protein ErpA [Aneurinibacillus sp. REN35]|uniref:iron-sulfur cluster insertion protein ErpA n=1 Tax=Aneurinibacillus sp. REN35 TaxID=3237286 RepID=UPI003527035B
MINLTEQASNKIKEMIASEDNANLFLRLGVRAGGCSGFSYGMGFDDEEQEGDVLFEEHGVKVVVQKDDIRFLDGVKIDYKESMMGGGFTIENPNAVASCGCGSSFRTRDDQGVPEEC